MEGFRSVQIISQFFLPTLPLFAFVELLALFTGRLGKSQSEVDHGWREAFLRSTAIWATLTFIFTELFSLRSALNSLSLALCWGIVCSVLIIILRSDFIINLLRYFRPSLKGIPFNQRFLVFWIIISLATTALIAIVSPPNNWDSMTYHMSRVAHWWANNSVDFYPTNIQRQLYSSPFAEYIILQFYVLSGGSDHLANLVQWFCFGGCAIVMSLIADRLGADCFTQCLVAFVVLTTPIVILEASSTQNDLVCALFVVMTLYYLSAGKTALTGISFGLAILTKSSAGLFILPFLLLLFLFESFNKRGWLKAVTRIFVIGCFVLVFNVPHWLRNSETFQNPLGYTIQVKWVESQTIAPGPFVSNLMKNLAAELITPIKSVSKVEEQSIRGVCKILGLDPDDPRNTFIPGGHFTVSTMANSEDYAANPLQVALLIAATLFLLVTSRFWFSEVMKYTLCVWAGFMLIAWRLSWQPWISRLHIPFLVLSSLPIAVFLAESRRHSRFIAGTIIVVLAAMSLFPLLFNVSRSYVTFRRAKSVFIEPRAEQYFATRPEEIHCYVHTIEILSKSSCRNVGLELGEDNWEYPLWALAGLRGTPMHFEHLEVDNETKNTKVAFQITPCATIIFHDAEPGVQPKPACIELHRFASNGDELIDRIDCKP